MTIKIAVVGAAGRMGREIARAAFGNDQVAIASAVEHAASEHLGEDLGALAGIGPIGVEIESTVDEAVAACDVVVDLSLPSATAAIVEAASSCGKPLLCGTTGLSDETMSLFEEASGTIPVLYATNLSPGVAALTRLVEMATTMLGPEYHIEIIEMHHAKKVDAPSGTALTLANAAAAGRGLDVNEAMIFGRSGNTGERSDRELAVHSVRGGSVFGDHTVILAGPNERIELSHRAGSRELFATGALRAAAFLADAKPGLYRMADILDSPR